MLALAFAAPAYAGTATFDATSGTVGFELAQVRAYIRAQEDEDPDGTGSF